MCSGRTVFKGEADQDEQRERLRPGDGRKKGGCQRQTKGDVLGERESAGPLLRLSKDREPQEVQTLACGDLGGCGWRSRRGGP